MAEATYALGDLKQLAAPYRLAARYRLERRPIRLDGSPETSPALLTEVQLRRLVADDEGRWTVDDLRLAPTHAGFRVRYARRPVEVTLRLEQRDDTRPAYRRTRHFNLMIEGQRPSRSQQTLADAVLLRLAEREPDGEDGEPEQEP